MHERYKEPKTTDTKRRTLLKNTNLGYARGQVFSALQARVDDLTHSITHDFLVRLADKLHEHFNALDAEVSVRFGVPAQVVTKIQ